MVEIKKLEEQIEKNFDTAAQEIEIIETWALKRNEKLTKRIEWISRKLELYLKNENLKTLDLPNGIIRIRKQPDKRINVDEELFFRKATDDLLNIIPESVKPDLLKIKA
ncbi:host-nuclease inhibitor Gam family protein [Ignavibacterium sp.]|uniref:host-nuclease inhibitor Gam family protein n=1 Tax=Ignavibacterium sp. TaxID=2651167 RepID=UPI00263362B1|nr:host-nuclease inhibitor Gam family protein [Ignavibacterium sp.]